MQQFFRSIALIPRDAQRRSWFCVWDAAHEWFDFVSGTFTDGESSRECLDRNVATTLGLESRSFLVSNMAQLNMEFAALLPCEPNVTRVKIAWYIVQLYNQAARRIVDSFPDSRWLSGGELLAGEAGDGLQVNPTLSYLLKRSEVIQAW